MTEAPQKAPLQASFANSGDASDARKKALRSDSTWSKILSAPLHAMLRQQSLTVAPPSPFALCGPAHPAALPPQIEQLSEVEEGQSRCGRKGLPERSRQATGKLP